MATRKKLSDEILSDDISELDDLELNDSEIKQIATDIKNSNSEDFDNTLIDIKEVSEDLSKSISDFLETSEPEESEPEESVACVPEQWILNLNINYCKKCCLPFSVDLYGNYQCENNIPDCPTIKK